MYSSQSINTYTGREYMARYDSNLCLESKTDRFKLKDIMRLINNWKKTKAREKELLGHSSLKSSYHNWMPFGIIMQINLFDKYIMDTYHTKLY